MNDLQRRAVIRMKATREYKPWSYLSDEDFFESFNNLTLDFLTLKIACEDLCQAISNKAKKLWEKK